MAYDVARQQKGRFGAMPGDQRGRGGLFAKC
jgi:hypothetical protein